MDLQLAADLSPPKKLLKNKVCVITKSVVTLKQLNAITNCLIKFMLSQKWIDTKKEEHPPNRFGERLERYSSTK